MIAVERGVGMVGALVRRARVAKGLTQGELALQTGLRQTYISQVEGGEIRLPRDHNLDALGKALGISRAEFYSESGMLDDIEGNPPPPRQLALISLTGEEEYEADALVAYVESRPGRIFQQQLAEARRERTYDEYVEFCLSIFRAWESNSNLGIKALALGRTSTGGL